MDYLKHQLEIQGIHSKMGLNYLSSILKEQKLSCNYKKINDVNQNYEENYDFVKLYEILCMKKQMNDSLALINYPETNDFKAKLIIGS